MFTQFAVEGIDEGGLRERERGEDGTVELWHLHWLFISHQMPKNSQIISQLYPTIYLDSGCISHDVHFLRSSHPWQIMKFPSHSFLTLWVRLVKRLPFGSLWVMRHICTSWPQMVKGLYTLVLEKKGHFYDFFLEKQHNFFFKLNVYLFLHFIRSFMNFFKRKYL